MLSSAVLAFLAGSTAVLASSGVSVTFAGEKVVNDVDNFKVVAKVTNTGDETLTLLNDPKTLLTPNWATKAFHISSAEGVVPEFKGVAVSNSLVFITLKSGPNICPYFLGCYIFRSSGQLPLLLRARRTL